MFGWFKKKKQEVKKEPRYLIKDEIKSVNIKKGNVTVFLSNGDNYIVEIVGEYTTASVYYPTRENKPIIHQPNIWELNNINQLNIDTISHALNTPKQWINLQNVFIVKAFLDGTSVKDHFVDVVYKTLEEVYD